MGNLSITEYGGLVKTSGGIEPVAKEPALARQNISYGASAASAAFGSNTKLVRLCSDSLGFLNFDTTAPTADGGDTRLPANAIEYISVNPGDFLAIYDGTS